ncbi:RNA methyltransferase [Bacteroidota bacterium]|nr:RNA methyltransferase [Bacteroidota bacterium]
MFSKPLEKYINSLRVKKFREEHRCFVAEGEKVVSEILPSSFTVDKILFTDKLKDKGMIMGKIAQEHMVVVEEYEMKKISELQNPPTVLALVHIPEYKIDISQLTKGLHLVLDGIQDPGNMGTIIRIADWFGIENIFCSINCVDAYNPKVIQASMGSIVRVKVFEKNIVEVLTESQLPKIITTMESETTIYKNDFSENAMIVIGSEGKGVSEEVKMLCTNQISIPKFGKAESLNAAVATGIICAALSEKRFRK